MLGAALELEFMFPCWVGFAALLLKQFAGSVWSVADLLPVPVK